MATVDRTQPADLLTILDYAAPASTGRIHQHLEDDRQKGAGIMRCRQRAADEGEGLCWVAVSRNAEVSPATPIKSAAGPPPRSFGAEKAKEEPQGERCGDAGKNEECHVPECQRRHVPETPAASGSDSR